MSALEPPPNMSTDEAERITEQIVGRIDSISENYEVVMMLMRDALARNAHSVLGYVSPGAYIKERFGRSLETLGESIRREFMHELSDAGLSTRAIAPVFNVSHMAVQRALSAGVTGVTPETSTALDTPTVPDLPVNPQTGEVYEAGDADHGSPEVPVTVTETHSVKTVTGLDGKQYTKAPPKEPRRTSLIDDARNAGWQLRKAVERLERIHQDDRFTKNKVEILAALQPHLDFANEVFSDL